MTELQRQAEAYAVVKSRIMNAANITAGRKLESATRIIETQGETIKELEAAIEKLRLNVADYQATLIAQARKICLLEGATVLEETTKIPVKKIVDSVLKDYPGVTWTDIISARRTRNLIRPRHQCMVEVFTLRPDLSYPAIGRIFARDHTTVISAVRKMKGARG